MRPDAAGGAHPPRDPVHERDQLRVHLHGRAPAAAPRRLRPERASPPPGAHPAPVAVAGDGVQVGPGRGPERRDEREPGQLGEVADGLDAELVQAPGRGRADAPEALDGQRVEEGALVVGRDDQQAVGLRGPAGHLRERLGPRDPDRQGQPDALANAPPQGRGDLLRRSADVLEPGDVEEGLLHREPLDHRRGLGELVEERLAGLDVGVEAGRNRDQVRAQPPRLAPAHRPADAVAPGLVAGRHHHPLADATGARAGPDRRAARRRRRTRRRPRGGSTAGPQPRTYVRINATRSQPLLAVYGR